MLAHAALARKGGIVRFLGWAAVLTVLGLAFLNGVVMLLSPETWFRMPEYLALRGTLRRDRLTSSGGDLGIRAFGFIVTVVVLSMLAGIVGGGVSPAGPASTRAIAPGRGPIYTGLCLTTCVAVGSCGLIMLVRPKRWVARFVLSRQPPEKSPTAALELVVRLLSLLLILPAFYFAWECLRAVYR